MMMLYGEDAGQAVPGEGEGWVKYFSLMIFSTIHQDN